MYKPSYSGSAHDEFVDQFESADDGDYLYRRNMTGPAYRVTADEMQVLVATHSRRERWYFRIAIVLVAGGGVLLVAVGLIWPAFMWQPAPPYMSGLGLVLMLVVQWILDRLLFRGPIRAVERRAPVAPALTIAERRRLSLERMSDSDVIWWALIGAMTLTFVIFLGLPDSPMMLLLIGVLAAMVFWAMIQGVRKWRLARADHGANNLI